MYSQTMRDRIKKFFSGFRKAENPVLVPASDKNASPRSAAPVGSVEAKEQGDVHMGTGDFAVAAQCYRQAIAADPNFARAHCNLAFALKELGQRADAEACVDTALDVDPANVDAHYLKATLCQDNDRLDDACRHFRKALELAPDFEFACRDLCFLLFRRGQIKEAQQVVIQAIAVSPTNPDLHYYLGNLYFEDRQFDLAASSFRACLSIQSERPDAYANLGLTLLKNDELDQAIAALHNALRLDPHLVDAYNNLGNALHRQNRIDEEIAAYQAGLAVDPHSFHLHYHLGLAQLAQKNADAAITSFTEALRIDPSNVEILSTLGETLRTQGKYVEAMACCNQILALEPRNADALCRLGILLQAQGQSSEAMACYRRALSVDPAHIVSLCSLGAALLADTRADEAVTHFRTILRIDPDHVDTLANLGNALQQQGKFEEALGSYRRALQIDPDNAQVLINSGAAKQNQGMLEEAIAYYHRALTVQPENVDAHLNLAIALEADGQVDLAIAQYRTILTIYPDHLQARYKLGLALQARMQHEEAMACFDALLTIDPNFVDAGLAKGLHSLLTGNFSDGWKGYEYRWLTKSGPSRPQFSQPQWTGREDLAGKTILVYGEQGCGDTIQFVRYVEKLAALGATVVLEMQPELISLLSTVPSIGKVISASDSFPAFDYHCSLLSLPLAFNTELSTIPAAVPYISAKESLAQLWREKLSCHSLPKIGIVWSGDPKHANDARRSMKLEAFVDLCSDERYQFFSLQKAMRDSDSKLLNSNSEIIDLGPELRDYDETAAIISNLDIVVTVDTSVAHLAGALGKPVWILLPHLPDFRWLLDRADSPWYPSARLFRQPSAGDWESVIEDVRNALDSRFVDEISAND